VTLLDEQAARAAFLRALSARRSVQQNVGPTFRRLCRIFWWLLDACEAHEDARGAQTVLILSETFYRSRTYPNDASVGAVPNEDREYLQVFVKRHPIWQVDFWQECFYRACRDEVHKLIDPATASNSRLASLFAAVDAADGGAAAASLPSDRPPSLPQLDGSEGAARSTASPAQARGDERASPSPAAAAAAAASGDGGDPSYAYTQASTCESRGPAHIASLKLQIVFGQLMALGVNMLSFGMPREAVDTLVKLLAVGNGLPKSLLDMLREMIAHNRPDGAT
jgi:hypothetical protein